MKPEKLTLILLVFILITALSACSGSSNDTSKIDVVKSYISANNENDMEAAATYLDEKVVFKTPTGNCNGIEACLGDAISEKPLREEPSNFKVDGNTVRWDMVVTFPDFSTPAKGEAVVENGKITVYAVLPP
jgi:hypothetical protein